MLEISHPFLVGMDYFFMNDLRLFFVMPFVSGGELYKIKEEYKKFDEQAVKFYAAQMVLAVGELHRNKVIHRDLKLENILVDESGYLKIIDFGLAKALP